MQILKRARGLAAAVAISAAAWPLAAGAAQARPNFLVVIVDDLGFSDLGAFGGEIATPNLDALARQGVRLTGFHTAPTCSPTRSMLMTGVDNHKAGLGSMAETLTPVQRGREGYEGHLNQRVATIAERLGEAGYYTAMAGKWHLGLEEDQSPAARGFDRSFALLQGLQNHFGDNQDERWEAIGERSTFREGLKLATYPKGVYSADYFTDRLLGFLAEAPADKPVFAYLAFTQPHWPLQAPAETVARYRGRYDAGPEVLREQRLARQKALGLIPAGVEPHAITGAPAWASLTPAQRAVEARKMEVYAAMVEEVDQNVGRVIKALRDAGRLDDTVIVFLSDNGAEGGDRDFPSRHRGAAAPSPEAIKAVGVDNSLDNIGRASSYVGYGPAWAQAASAPSRLFKAYTTEGGIRAVAFAAGAGVKGGRVSNAFLHVKDIPATLLDLADAPQSPTFRGRPVAAIEGRSWAGLLAGEQAEVRSAADPVGWELFFRRAIRQGDWKAVYLPASAGIGTTPTTEGRWELFDLGRDPGETHDLAAAEPARLQSLVRAWNAYAADAGVVLPDGTSPQAVRAER